MRKPTPFIAPWLLCACAGQGGDVPVNVAPTQAEVIVLAAPRANPSPPAAATATPKADTSGLDPAASNIPATCLSAEHEGPIGNCIEPALLITDSCSGRTFSFGFNGCLASRFDERRLVVDGGHMIGAGVHDTIRQTSLGEVTAVRGRVVRGERLEPQQLSYDLEVDLLEGGRQTTFHLVGSGSAGGF